MYLVNGEYPDYHRDNNKGSFSLNPDKTMSPFSWTPPIMWEGFVNGKAVKFTQISTNSYDRNDFDFSEFPKQLDSVIPYIIEAIDDKMKIMN